MAWLALILVCCLVLGFFKHLKIYFLIIALFKEVERIVRGTPLAVHYLRSTELGQFMKQSTLQGSYFIILFHHVLFCYCLDLDPPSTLALPSAPPQVFYIDSSIPPPIVYLVN